MHRAKKKYNFIVLFVLLSFLLVVLTMDASDMIHDAFDTFEDVVMAESDSQRVIRFL